MDINRIHSQAQMIPILYGSQTGTSMYASQLIKRAIEHGYDSRTIYNIDYFIHTQNQRCSIVEMDLFDMERIFDINFIVFVCSTHGDGSEPFNMSRFWSFISRSDLPPGIFNHLRFGIFGLGDSSYEQFNYCSKRLFNRLKMLGAEPVIRRGEGDSRDIDGFLTDLRPWISELMIYINENDVDSSVEDIVIAPENYSSTLVSKRRLTPDDHTQEIIELVFDIPEYQSFSPGDCLSFLPTNYNYLEFMNHNGMTNESDTQYMVMSVIDFNSCPHQPFFFELGHFLGTRRDIDDEVKQKIDEIAEDYDLYYEYIIKPKRTIFEVLKDLRVSVDMPFIKRFIPSIYPRFFSVTRRDGLYHVTIAVVKHFTILKDPRRSICSEYLMNRHPGDEIKIGIGRSNLYFKSRKLLFLCTGVGISLPRACVNEFKDKEIVIFYGFRSRSKDFLYHDEWSGENITLFTAASRDDGMYIQEVFKRNHIEDIDEYLVFVSGNSRLSKEMKRLFLDVYGRGIVFQSETW